MYEPFQGWGGIAKRQRMSIAGNIDPRGRHEVDGDDTRRGLAEITAAAANLQDRHPHRQRVQQSAVIIDVDRP